MWLVHVAVRRYIDIFIILLIPAPFVLALFAAAVSLLLINLSILFLFLFIIESVDSISKDERGFPLTQYITNGRISRAG